MRALRPVALVIFGALAVAAATRIAAARGPKTGQAARLRPVPLCSATPACPWPAESPSSAVNLTDVEGPGANDFHEDLSGAFWNPNENALWLCRNGGSGGSKVWKLVPDGPDSFRVGTVGGQRAEWTGFGDCEAVALASLAAPASVYTIDESTSSIREWDLAASTVVSRASWNLSAHVPTYANGLGIEGLCFVPDDVLAARGFVDAGGAPRTSALGLGALAFVAHQNGGRVYAFDLDPAGGAFAFVGEYATSDPETAELTFDPPSGLLFAWHGDDRNDLEVMRLASEPAGAIRRFVRVLTYDFPGTGNQEGFALQWSPGGCGGTRGAFVTTDDGGATALRWFRQFPCGF